MQHQVPHPYTYTTHPLYIDLVYIVRSGVLVRDQCMNIRPGDIVRVKEGDTVPADLVIISSSFDESIAFYSTAALDGESNLKKAISLRKTAGFKNPDEITQIRSIIKKFPTKPAEAKVSVASWDVLVTCCILPSVTLTRETSW